MSVQKSYAYYTEAYIIEVDVVGMTFDEVFDMISQIVPAYIVQEIVYFQGEKKISYIEIDGYIDTNAAEEIEVLLNIEEYEEPLEEQAIIRIVVNDAETYNVLHPSKLLKEMTQWLNQ